jgi:hypothetical protein
VRVGVGFRDWRAQSAAGGCWGGQVFPRAREQNRDSIGTGRSWFVRLSKRLGDKIAMLIGRRSQRTAFRDAQFQKLREHPKFCLPRTLRNMLQLDEHDVLGLSEAWPNSPSLGSRRDGLECVILIRAHSVS